jgi:hypothetical protein
MCARLTRCLVSYLPHVKEDLELSKVGALVADAGCVLESLSEYIAPHKHIMPLDLGAKGRYIMHAAISLLVHDLFA